MADDTHSRWHTDRIAVVVSTPSRSGSRNALHVVVPAHSRAARMDATPIP